jgi:hypothetical protein
VCNTLFSFAEKRFAEYTMNNISTPHVLRGSDLKFTYQVQSGESGYNEMNIYLMVNNHNVISGDMYYIKMDGQIYNYRYGNLNMYLSKCTSLYNSGDRISLPGESAERWCARQTHVSIFQFLL